MPSSVVSFDLASQWQPVSHCLASIHQEAGALAESADSVLGEVELIRQELVARAIELEQLQLQLAEREDHLAKQRTEHTRLCSLFEQQEARLTDTMEELRRLREELAGRVTPESIAADAAREALQQARELWEKDRAELLERINSLVVMQQTGSGDSEAVKAFCHELSQIQELINNSHLKTREAIERERQELQNRLAPVLEAGQQSPLSEEALADLRSSLASLREELASLQSQSLATASRDKDELLQRLNALTDAKQDAPEEKELLESIQRELTEMKRLVESVQSSSGGPSPEHDALIAELRAELAEMKRIAEETRQQATHAAQEQEAVNGLRSELEALRRLADEARDQAARQETERTLVEAELDRLRTQAAQWRRDLEEETLRHQTEERLWREELQDLRQLVQQAAAMAESPARPPEPHVERAAAVEKAAIEPAEPDPVANSLMAQFAKLQKDSARRRNRGSNS